MQFFEIVKDTLHQQFKMSIDKLLGGLASSGGLKDDDIRCTVMYYVELHVQPYVTVNTVHACAYHST